MTDSGRPTALVSLGPAGQLEAVQAALSDAGWFVASDVEQAHDRIDLLVAGPLHVGYGALETTDQADWWSIVDAGAGHAFRTARACAPALEVNGGSIVFVSSQAGVRGTALGSAVSASSGAIIGLTRALAIELAPVRVNAVAAGLADDELELNSLSRAASTTIAETRSASAEMTLLGRLATYADLAAAVAFLASPQAAYMTGEVIGPNGGRTQQ